MNKNRYKINNILIKKLNKKYKDIKHNNANNNRNDNNRNNNKQ